MELGSSWIYDLGQISAREFDLGGLLGSCSDVWNMYMSVMKKYMYAVYIYIYIHMYIYIHIYTYIIHTYTHIHTQTSLVRDSTAAY